jgi:hypothetical protein
MNCRVHSPKVFGPVFSQFVPENDRLSNWRVAPNISRSEQGPSAFTILSHNKQPPNLTWILKDQMPELIWNPSLACNPYDPYVRLWMSQDKRSLFNWAIVKDEFFSIISILVWIILAHLLIDNVQILCIPILSMKICLWSEDKFIAI